jgi:uncharacterized protein YgbK (DUF1537 family)
MAEWGVIADDLTGANTTACLLTTSGFRALTTINHHDFDRFDFDRYDAIVVNAASRPLPMEEARHRLEACTRELAGRGIRYFSKRIDSTIRGNLGAEIEGMLTALSPEAIACVVAVYPDSGRMVVGGYQLVGNVPVSKTAAGCDPIKPVRSSFVAREIAAQTDLPIGRVELETVLGGKDAIAADIARHVREGRKILVFDAINFADITAITEGVHSLGIPWVAVDPGPLARAACILTHNGKPRGGGRNKKGKILIVAGSATDLTRSQLSYLQQDCKARFVNVDILPFLDSEEEQAGEDAVAEEVWALGKCADIFGVRAAEHVSMVVDIHREARERGITTDDIARRITMALARIAKKTLARGVPDLKGVYLTGGDMTVAFCEQLGVEALELIEEVLPHVSYGTLVGGDLHGVRIITKGGLIGDIDAAKVCAKYMLGK